MDTFREHPRLPWKQKHGSFSEKFSWNYSRKYYVEKEENPLCFQKISTRKRGRTCSSEKHAQSKPNAGMLTGSGAMQNAFSGSFSSVIIAVSMRMLLISPTNDNMGQNMDWISILCTNHNSPWGWNRNKQPFPQAWAKAKRMKTRDACLRLLKWSEGRRGSLGRFCCGPCLGVAHNSLGWERIFLETWES